MIFFCVPVINGNTNLACQAGLGQHWENSLRKDRVNILWWLTYLTVSEGGIVHKFIEATLYVYKNKSRKISLDLNLLYLVSLANTKATVQ